MSLSEQTQRIVRLVWSRMLKLDDHDLDGPANGRIEVPDANAGAVTAVRLFDHTVLYGPSDVIGTARQLPDADLYQDVTLLRIARQQSDRARILGTAHLLYAETPPAVSPSADVAVSFEPSHLQQLLDANPNDDVALSGLSDAEWTATLVNTVSAHVPVAAAGYQVWHHMLAHLGMLTSPRHRAQGLGSYIASVATQDAFDEGLIPQWRAAAGSPGSSRVATSLGFVRAGWQSTVVLR